MSVPRENPRLSSIVPPSLTYEPYYGLKEKPFSLSADPKFLYKSPAHAAAFDQLQAGIRRREGLIVLTGEIGTGKTTLCRAVLGSLDRRTFSTFVPDPFLSREDLLKMLLVDFGVMSIDDLKSGRLQGASRPELHYPLYEFLNSLVPLQAYAVLVIDEAQNLPLSLLEEIRILSDLEGREKLLQVVLIGQPELRANLQLPQMRQVDQRISVRCQLRPLGRHHVNAYVSNRLHVASGDVPRVHFADDALDRIHQASGGTPRVINLICDRALHEGFARQTSTIDAGLVAAAIEALGLASQPAAAAESLPAPAAVGADPLDAFSDATAAFSDRWQRLAWVWVLVAMLVGAGGAAAWLTSLDRRSREIALPAFPAAPRLATRPAPAALPVPAPEPERRVSPAAPGQYVIQVASFESPARAARLVAQLTNAGFRAYDAEFITDAGGRIRLVIVGGYDTVTRAQADLTRIQAIPGYHDATVRVILHESASR